MLKEEKVKIILERLKKIWPEPKTELIYSSPWELLVAVILSAQANDKTVNKVTPDLFKHLPTIYDFAHSSVEEIDILVKKINFHKNKSKNIFNAALKIVNDFQGNVPETMQELITLPGVARKTANVILGTAFNKPEGIAVDTHVRRLSQAFGLTKENDPVKIEKDLLKIVPKSEWTNFSHLLILYGRYDCPARKKCSDCEILSDICE
jgi:endonuclease-3